MSPVILPKTFFIESDLVICDEVSLLKQKTVILDQNVDFLCENLYSEFTLLQMKDALINFMRSISLKVILN